MSSLGHLGRACVVAATAGVLGALVLAVPGVASAKPATTITVTAPIKLFTVPSADSGLSHIVKGPDGNLWFTESNGSKVARITPSGQISEYPVSLQDYSNHDEGPSVITSSGGALWFLADGGGFGDSVYRIVPGQTAPTLVQSDQYDALVSLAPSDTGGVWAANLLGNLTQGDDDDSLQLVGPGGFPDRDFPVSLGGQINPIPLASSGGAVWAADDGDYVKKATDAGAAVNYPVSSPQPTYYISSMAFDRRGRLWLSEYMPGSWVLGDTGGAIGVLKPGATSATLTDTNTGPAAVSDVAPHALVLGPDGAMWFAWRRGVGRINPSTGQIQYTILSPYKVTDMAFGSDGNLWFIDQGANTIGRIATSSLIPHPTAPTATVTVPRQKLSGVRRSGKLKATCRLSGAGTCAVAATIPAKTARHLKLKLGRKAKTVTLARGSRRFTKAGRATLTLTLSGPAKRALKRVRTIKVTVTATGSAKGVRTTHTQRRALTLSR